MTDAEAQFSSAGKHPTAQGRVSHMVIAMHLFLEFRKLPLSNWYGMQHFPTAVGLSQGIICFVKCIYSETKLRHGETINSENSLGLQTAPSLSSFTRSVHSDVSFSQSACEVSTYIQSQQIIMQFQIHIDPTVCNKKNQRHPTSMDKNSEKQPNIDTNNVNELFKCLQSKGQHGELQAHLKNTSQLVSTTLKKQTRLSDVLQQQEKFALQGIYPEITPGNSPASTTPTLESSSVKQSQTTRILRSTTTQTTSTVCKRPLKDESLCISYPHALAPASLAAGLGKAP